MTKRVKIGNLYIGGGESVKIQSMTTFKAKEIENTVEQILALEKEGCDIARFSILDIADCNAIKKIKEQTHIPLVADIHFDYRLAVSAIENGIDKVRLNPGNIGGEREIGIVADCLKAHNIPVRVGANSGSIEKSLLDEYGVCAKSLTESALRNARILEKHGVENIVLSVKSSTVQVNIESYRLLSTLTDYPLHIGVTEAGGGTSGIVKNAVGIGSLLIDGIGDTLRVSLSDEPIKEIRAAKEILRAVGKDKNYVDVVACPTCGRCEWDCMAFASKIKDLTKNITKPFKVAVMGCVVNGVGEGKESDLGIAGGKDKAVIFKKGEIIAQMDFDKAEQFFIKELERCLN